MASSTQPIALSDTYQDDIASSVEAMEYEVSSLPPTDHGKPAYLVLVSCTLIQAPVWGTQDIGR